MKGCRYTIDARDRFVSVDADWEDCARKFDLPSLRADVVLGRSLWTIISDTRLCVLLGHLLSKSRRTRTTIRLPFRCDGPTERRWMQLEMTADSQRFVRFQTTLLQSEARTPVLPDSPGKEATGDTLSICSWCNAVQASDGRWMELEDDLALEPERFQVTPSIAHCMCPDCDAQLTAAAQEPDRTSPA